jgi:hypothetical protein
MSFTESLVVAGESKARSEDIVTDDPKCPQPSETSPPPFVVSVVLTVASVDTVCGKSVHEPVDSRV